MGQRKVSKATRIFETTKIVERIRDLNAGKISLGPGKYEDDYDRETVRLAKEALKRLRRLLRSEEKSSGQSAKGQNHS